MGNNYIIDKSFQLLRTNVLLTSNLKIDVTTDYKMYLESINSTTILNNDKYKHFYFSNKKYLEDIIPDFYDKLPVNIAFYVKDDNDEDIVYTDYKDQYDTLYWSGVAKIKDNKRFTEEYEYFAPLYINPNNLPNGFIILRLDDPAIYELFEGDKKITNTNKENFKEQIIDKWKCVEYYDMTIQSKFGEWLDINYVNNERFPKTPLEFDFKKYNFTRWYGIDYETGVYTNKSMYLDDKLYNENPHFKLEQFITEGYKNNELIYPNIANFNFIFDDNPASPYKYKKYSINRYLGFYVDLELVNIVTPYRAKTIVDNLRLENNIFMSINQITGSTMPFESWDDNQDYYIQANNGLYKVIRTYENNTYYYKIIADFDIDINDITRDNEIDIIFNELDEGKYNNEIKSRNVLELYLDQLITNNGLEEFYSDLYLIKIDNKYHVIENKRNEYTGLLEHYIRTDYAIQCDDNILKYWVSNKEEYVEKYVESEEIPMFFEIYRVSFMDIKDFDFNRVDTGYADFDFDKNEYVDTIEHKLYTIEHRDASINTVYKTYDIDDINSEKIINVSSEYISTDELFEINKNGLSKIWDKNPTIVKWGYKNSLSHSNYPYKLNNSKKVGGVHNRTTDINSNFIDILGKTNEYFYRIGEFYKIEEVDSVINDNIQYYNTQTLSIQTELMNTKYFDLDVYLNSDLDYFDYFFKNNRKISETEYEQTTNFSIINSGDVYVESSTLFKGIKFNITELKDLGFDEKIKRYITTKTGKYNGYKFSIILNSVYEEFNLNYTNNKSVISTQNILNDEDNGIHVFINDKFKNILVIINVNFGESAYNDLFTFNNETYFEPRQGFYLNKITYGEHSGETAFSSFNPNVLSVSNFINTLNNLNTKNLYDNYVKYHYIDSNNEYGCVVMNDINNNTLSGISSWNKHFPPIILDCDMPNVMKTKKSSYKIASLKGPKFNIYDKFKTDYNDNIYNREFIDEPLSRIIELDEKEPKYDPKFKGNLEYDNTILRYNGSYEPIFKDVELYDNVNYNVINGGIFKQLKCGGFINNINSTNFSMVNEIINMENKIEYIENEISSIDIEINNATLVNDDLSLDKLIDQKEYYYYLLSSYTSTLSAYTNVNETEIVDDGDYGWNFKDNALGICNGNYATCDYIFNMVEIKKTSKYLTINKFGFNIPENSTITNIRVKINKKSTISDENISVVVDNDLRLLKPNGELSDNFSNYPPTGDDIDNISATTYAWGTELNETVYTLSSFTLNSQDVNNELFGVKIKTDCYKKNNSVPLVNTSYIDCLCVELSYTIDGIETGKTYITKSQKNSKFDTQLKSFGEIDEIMFSKVNENDNPLKIKNTEEDKSIYPMIDEFGLTWDKKFIFKSSWDDDYYNRTKNELE